MNKNMIGYIITIILFWYIFGWKGGLFAAFFGLFSWFTPPQKTTPSSNAFPFFLWSDTKKSKDK